MISVNEYFGGNVKSLGYATENGKSTVGVMNEGEYEFSTGSAETMTVIQGKMEVKIKGEEDINIYEDGESFDVPANSKFWVNVLFQTSYLCEYE
jgi:purine/pyrimidine-nucleoside phosphorylase